MAAKCTYADQQRDVKPQSAGCEDYLKTGGCWVVLRMCLVCGHAGCCDSSPGRHATGHFHATGHAIMKSVEPDDGWSWCYIDATYL
jgi:ubiquitin-hydrolase Zn-finger-containing protein